MWEVEEKDLKRCLNSKGFSLKPTKKGYMFVKGDTYGSWHTPHGKFAPLVANVFLKRCRFDLGRSMMSNVVVIIDVSILHLSMPARGEDEKPTRKGYMLYGSWQDSQ